MANLYKMEVSFLIKKNAAAFLFRTTLFLFLTVFSSCSKDDEVNGLSVVSISPDSGGKDTEVVITGTGFSNDPSENTVMLNGNNCTIINATSTELTILIPENAGSGNLIVSRGSRAAQSEVFTFIYLSITSITPAIGGGGTEVVISGTGFSATASENSVTINNKPCEVIHATSTRLTVTVPTQAGSGTIKITNGGTTIEGPTFEYILTRTVTTLAGGVSGFSDGAGNLAKFDLPHDVAADASGNIYVADRLNNRIRKITSEGMVSTLAGGNEGFVDGSGSLAQFYQPHGIATDAAGNIYVADTYNCKIRKITQAGEVSTIAGSERGFADGTATEAKFDLPYDIAVDIDGNVYVADQVNHKIRKISTAGVVTTLAGSSPGYADGTGGAAQFYQPLGIATDVSGNVYVADVGNDRIRKITPDGIVTTLAGSTDGYADGIGTSAKFSSPSGVVTDAAGNVYVADTNNNKIRKITPTGVVSTFREALSDSENILFSRSLGITADDDGNIYVAEASSHRIRKISTEE